MCGRFALAIPRFEILSFLPGVNIDLWTGPRYNIAPGQNIWAVTCEEPSVLKPIRWGLVPSWSKDLSISSRLINARLETIHEKPSFRKPLAHQRCLLIASGFFEWRRDIATKSGIPYYIRRIDGKPFSFAGIWDRWRSPENATLITCAIITMEANNDIRPLHHRMPFILTPESHSAWLDTAITDHRELFTRVESIPAGTLAFHEAQSIVNNPLNDTPACIPL